MSRAELKKNYSHKWYENCYQKFEYHNNIVSFCADRGQGKTSAMLSVAESLRTIESRDQAEKKQQFWKKAMDEETPNPVLDTHFECLPVSDPNSLEKNDSILWTVMSKMFKAASEKWEMLSENLSSRHNNEKRRKKEMLADQFLKCFKGLDYLYKEKKEISSYYDDLNMAAEYGDSNNMKEAFMKLVQDYLDFMADDYQKSMLVILIDDADLNIEHAYSIVEEIRKYCIMPGVLVLMAMHIGTLARTLEQHFLQQYKSLIEIKKDSFSKERCHNAMERYITKLMPAAHRIYLPSIRNVSEGGYNKLTLYYIQKNNGSEKDLLEDYQYVQKGSLTDTGFQDNYENRLFCLIYAKTGIILTRKGNLLHPFLPDNFRHLNHFLFYMNNIHNIISPEDVGKDKYGIFESIFDDIRKGNANRKETKLKVADCLENLDLFMNYFLRIWCPERLTERQLDVIERIDSSPLHLKNFIAVQNIKNIINNNEDRSTAVIADLREQKQEEVQYTPLSDVIWALNRLEQSVSQKNLFTFICAVRMYYTIYLHITAMKGILNYQKGNEPFSFDSLYNLLGGHIFPMHYYYMKIKLPFYIFDIDVKSLFDDPNVYDSILRFLRPCFADEKSGIIKNCNPFRQSRKCESKRYTVDFRLSDKDSYSLTKYQLFDFMAPILTLFEYDRPDMIINDTSSQQDGALYSTLNFVCNLDLQELICNNFFCDRSFNGLLTQQGVLSSSKTELGTFLHMIYIYFDSLINKHNCIKIKSCLHMLISETMKNDLLLIRHTHSFFDQDIWKSLNVHDEYIPAIPSLSFDMKPDRRSNRNNNPPQKKKRPELPSAPQAAPQKTGKAGSHDANNVMDVLSSAQNDNPSTGKKKTGNKP